MKRRACRFRFRCGYGILSEERELCRQQFSSHGFLGAVPCGTDPICGRRSAAIGVYPMRSRTGGEATFDLEYSSAAARRRLDRKREEAVTFTLCQRGRRY
jgi:hypothetical protein